MAKLTKAKRTKRRWLGCWVSPSIHTRKQLEEQMASICPDMNIRLYDFHRGDGPVALQVGDVCENSELHHRCMKKPDGFGVAIFCVLLPEYAQIRDAVSPNYTGSGEAKVNAEIADDRISMVKSLGFCSVTTSGKIRLVRERLHIPRPPRKRK